MSSLLQPTILLDSCHSGLRERRRSSMNTLNALPLLFQTSTVEGSAICDENELSGREQPTALLSGVKQAHLPNHTSKIYITTDLRPLSTPQTPDVDTPTSTVPSTAAHSRKPSLITLPNDIPRLDTLDRKLERLNWRLASGFFAYFMCGWGDGVTGTVLPYFMKEYNISFMTSSLVYAGSTIGFIIGTTLVESIIAKLGRFDPQEPTPAWIPKHIFGSPGSSATPKAGYSPSQAHVLSILVSSILHGMFFLMMGFKGGFPVLFCSYALAAFARSILTASLNAYFAAGPRQSVGFAFALWSLGGVVSPLLCQSLIAAGVPWFKFYFGSLVMSAFNTTFLVLTHRPTPNEIHRDRQAALAAAEPAHDNEKYSQCESPTQDTVEELRSGSQKTLHIAIRKPYLLAVAAFAFLYCGCETSTQALMVSYLLGVRDANPKTAGYVTSGFWGGITIGRLAWGHFTPRLSFTQRKFAILAYVSNMNWSLASAKLLLNDVFLHEGTGLVMQVTIWLVESEVENAVATAIIGLVYGPVFPACLILSNDLLPAELTRVSMGIISATASLGAAFFPFLAGVVSSKKGIHTLTYMIVPLATVIFGLWILFPSRQPLRR